MGRRFDLSSMSSERFAEVRTPLILSILMVLMTQVGYLDLMNAWSGEEETLDDAEPVVAYSPATSVMHGNNSMWVSGVNGPVRNLRFNALFNKMRVKNKSSRGPRDKHAICSPIWG